MKLSTFIIGAIIFSAFFVGIGMFVDNVYSNYNQSYSDQAYNVTEYSRLAQMKEWVNQTYQTTLNQTSTVTISNLGLFLWRAPAVIGAGLSSAVNIISSVLSTLIGAIGLPTWIISVTFAIIMVIAVTIIFRLLLGREI